MHYELYQASQEALFRWYGNTYAIMTENVEFTPPADGSPWLKYDYIEAMTQTVSLDRKCKVYVGIAQVGVVFSPGTGISLARSIAKELAIRAVDGMILTVTDENDISTEVGYIVEGGEVQPVVKHNSGWMIPVRFTVRAESA